MVEWKDGYDMTELEKCMAGLNYNCHDGVFLEYKRKARELLTKYNALPYGCGKEKTEILGRLLGNIGTNVSIATPFLCDYGCNTYIGNNVSINMNCTFVDCNKIQIGNQVLVSSNVQIYTSTHPIELSERITPGWNPESGEYFCRTYALPVKIGDGCWVGGGVIILPGVTIGDGTVIGAGSVVTKDISGNCVAAGNPCKVLRRINGDNA